MKVLLPAAEVAPIIKLGGLGDVVGSLPKALEKIGVNVDVIVPFYPTAKVQDVKIFKAFDLEVPYDDTANLVEVYKTKLPDSNVDVLLLKNSKYFSRGGKDAFANKISETEMFAFFSRAVVEFVKAQFNTYDLVHCNDWHTGMIPHLLDDELAETRPAVLYTVHNLAYQGIGDQELVQNMGIVPGDHPLIDWDIADGDVNFMLQGITSSDYVGTVSPTYAKEILTPEYGGDLVDVLQVRESRVAGILNGIDTSSFPRDYTSHNWREAKKDHKAALLEKFGLTDPQKPLVSFIGRLDPNQKGLDILYEAIPSIVKAGGNFVLLGTGDAGWQDKLTKFAEQDDLRGAVSINIMFDVDLARKIYSGSDFLIVPSKYEPCGLIQMISMWYGTLPIVRATGGLKDSVTEGKTGFLFDDYSSQALIEAVNKALITYSGHGETSFDSMVVAAMQADFSWDSSAREYKKLYEKVHALRKEVANA